MQYDRWAEGYDRRWRRYTTRTHAALLAWADLRDAIHVLDVGCGAGALMRSLFARWPHLHILGVEPSAGMRRVAMATLAPLIEVGGNITVAAGTCAGRLAHPPAKALDIALDTTLGHMSFTR